MEESPSVLCIVDQGHPDFESRRADVTVVCAGDSLTGWNNFGSPSNWPFPTYPHDLAKLGASRGLNIANGGIAGDISKNGPRQVRDYLEWFPNAQYFIMGIGTNDFATWDETEVVSRRIMGNIRQMVQLLIDRGKQPILFNVPHVNESMFPRQMADETHAKRDYHNPRLKEFCVEHRIPLADICSRLRDEHFGDNVHPNAEGARIVATVVFDALNAV